MRDMSLRLFSAASVIVLAALLATGCAIREVAAEPPIVRETAEEAAAPASDAWVVVKFEERGVDFDLSLMESMLETELAADEALAAADAGWIDGNDVGAGEYVLYFVGVDAERMWEVLEPVFDDAPVMWTRVELRNGLEDPSPRTITR